ncbi:MAG TPA: ABC transporter permease [Bacilli bacterium]
MEMKQMWMKRATQFWMSILPYFRYVIQSGFLIFLILGSIVFSVLYAQWLQQLPDNFQGKWIVALALIPVLAASPVRTFLKKADLVYLLPLESKMGGYTRSSLVYSFVFQSVLVCLVFFVALPLYVPGDNIAPVLGLLFFVLLIKSVNLYGSWQEKKFSMTSSRRIYTLLRWAGTSGLILLILWFPLQQAGLILLLVLFTYVVSLQLPSRYNIRWELLVQLEQHALSRWYYFISWFVDIPERPAQISRRPLISRLTNVVPFLQSHTYRYLYLKSFVRTELYGIVLRLTLIGMIVISAVENDVVKGFIFLLFVYFCGVQLSALKQQHRYVFWVNIYPLPLSGREPSAVSVIFRLHLVVVLLLSVPIFITMSNLIGLLLLPAGGAILSYLQNYGALKRKSG